jgi:hypothetical protein
MTARKKEGRAQATPPSISYRDSLKARIALRKKKTAKKGKKTG